MTLRWNKLELSLQADNQPNRVCIGTLYNPESCHIFLRAQISVSVMVCPLLFYDMPFAFLCHARWIRAICVCQILFSFSQDLVLLHFQTFLRESLSDIFKLIVYIFHYRFLYFLFWLNINRSPRQARNRSAWCGCTRRQEFWASNN